MAAYTNDRTTVPHVAQGHSVADEGAMSAENT